MFPQGPGQGIGGILKALQLGDRLAKSTTGQGLFEIMRARSDSSQPGRPQSGPTVPVGSRSSFEQLLGAGIRRSSMAPPAPAERKSLDGRETLLPAGVSALAMLLGARPKYVLPAFGTYLSGRRSQLDSEREEADRQAMSQYGKDVAAADADLFEAEQRYKRDEALRTEELERSKDALDHAQAKELEGLRSSGRVELAETNLRKHPQAKWLQMFEDGDMTLEQFLEQSGGQTPSEMRRTIADAEFKEAKTKTENETREYVVAELKAKANLTDQQAQHWAKRVKNFDKETAIELALLAAQIEKVKAETDKVKFPDLYDKSESDGDQLGRLIDLRKTYLDELDDVTRQLGEKFLKEEDPDRYRSLLDEQKAIKTKLEKVDSDIGLTRQRYNRQGPTSSSRSSGITGAAAKISGAYDRGRVSSSKYDCSEFVCKAYKDAGMPNPGGTTVEIVRKAKEENVWSESTDDMGDGDIIVWHSPSAPNKMHTGIYMGDGMVRHSSSSLGRIVTVPLSSVRLKIKGVARYSGRTASLENAGSGISRYEEFIA